MRACMYNTKNRRHTRISANFRSVLLYVSTRAIIIQINVPLVRGCRGLHSTPEDSIAAWSRLPKGLYRWEHLRGKSLACVAMNQTPDNSADHMFLRWISTKFALHRNSVSTAPILDIFIQMEIFVWLWLESSSDSRRASQALHHSSKIAVPTKFQM